jgi:hypothetical protein
MPLSDSELTDAALELAQIAGVVANVCDHAEHNEVVDMQDVRRSAKHLRVLGVRLAWAAGRNPIDLYAERLRIIERRNVVHEPTAFDGEAAVHEARTWRQLQLVQLEHDRTYHLDVVGLTKADQLRHYALHVAKLAGAAAGAVGSSDLVEDFVTRRVADTILFGIKLSTVTGERLGNETAEDLAAPPDSSSIARVPISSAS